MEDQQFDDLVRGLAQSVSRRQVLKAALAAATGGLLIRSGVGGAEAQVNGQIKAICSKWCLQEYHMGPAQQACLVGALKGNGACYTCGPGAPVGHPDVCAVGTTGAFCCSSTTPNCCGSTCTSLQTDVNNCGICGNQCAAGGSCVAGTCMYGTCNNPGNCNTNFSNCSGNSNTNCYCFTTTEGTGMCGCNTFCSQAAGCSSSSSCPTGYTCITSNGCNGCSSSGGVCVPICTGANATCGLGGSSIKASDVGVTRLTAISRA